MLPHHSLYGWSTPTLKLARRIKCSISRRYITVSVSQDADHATPTELQASFQGVRDRLHKIQSRKELLRTLQEKLISYEDGRRLCSVCPDLIQALENCWRHSTAVEELQDINAVIARLNYVGVPPPDQLLQYSIIKAARREFPAAVMAYVLMINPEQEGNLRNRVPITEVLAAFLKHEPHRQSFHGWNGQQKRQAWSHIIQVLLLEWEQMVGLSGDGKGTHDTHNHNTNLNKFIQAFIHLGEAELAWQVAKSHEHRFGPLQAGTWDMLLNHPSEIKGWLPALARQYENRLKALERTTFNVLFTRPDLIKKWTPHMNEPVKLELERRLRKIESLMQMKWKGGENGFHQPKRRN